MERGGQGAGQQVSAPPEGGDMTGAVTGRGSLVVTEDLELWAEGVRGIGGRRGKVLGPGQMAEYCCHCRCDEEEGVNGGAAESRARPVQVIAGGTAALVE